MTRLGSTIGSIAFLGLAPGIVAGVIPWWMTGWIRHEGTMTYVLAPIGAVLIGLGLVVLLESFGRFAWQGVGTPAPVLPTRHLVASGLYRWVRNPMYVAVVSIVFGQGLYFGQTVLVIYGVVLWLIFHTFVLTYEEPTLRRTFPDDYVVYFAHVPRWLPRLRPWMQGQDD